LPSGLFRRAPNGIPYRANARYKLHALPKNQQNEGEKKKLAHT
jgi:hypothetical protein